MNSIISVICFSGHSTKKFDSTARARDAFVLVTPAYFGDLSESAQRFLDRIWRVETFSGRDTFIGTRTIGVAAAWGSGNGAARALHNLEDYLKRWASS
ncbi:NAD(P)H-dependent oxidoreductase [Candidatus Bathyarchaeota archaeon]|nr:NAD(P)H-dependent oxidoreductase [Candidatus Bathyarchaeota archaeon]